MPIITSFYTVQQYYFNRKTTITFLSEILFCLSYRYVSSSDTENILLNISYNFIVKYVILTIHYKQNDNVVIINLDLYPIDKQQHVI